MFKTHYAKILTSLESVDKYVQATKAWLNDEDIESDKLFNYWKYVANY